MKLIYRRCQTWQADVEGARGQTETLRPFVAQRWCRIRPFAETERWNR